MRISFINLARNNNSNTPMSLFRLFHIDLSCRLFRTIGTPDTIGIQQEKVMIKILYISFSIMILINNNLTKIA